MPVSIGSELKLENNKVNAYYDNLFRKLNVAKAWTNTQTTESGGTVSVIINDGEILTNMQSGYNDWFINDYSNTCIIGGKLYLYNNGSLVQIGSESNWKQATNIGTGTVVYAINSNNKLYYMRGITTSGTYTQIEELGSGIHWEYIDGSWYAGYAYTYAIGDGKLYRFRSNGNSPGGPNQVGSDTGWTKIINISSYDACGICNGYVYITTDGTNLSLLNANNDFIDIQTYTASTSTDKSIVCLNSSGELYWNVGNTLEKSTFNNGFVKQFTVSSNRVILALTEDKKIYLCNAGSFTSWTNILTDKSWTWIRYVDNSIAYGISDGKLYKISISSAAVYSYTQIGSTTGYKKISGNKGTTFISLAWTGNATHTETTVYTTQNPIANDKTYSDTNLTEYSTVQSCTGTILTDEYRTYNLDTAKNSSFTNIPPATIHETIKAIDIIRATE